MLVFHRSQAQALCLPWLGLAAFNLALAIATSTVQTSDAAQSQTPTGGLSPTDLRCEYRDHPLGVDATAPRLSWIVSSSRRGQLQTAYHVLVASDLATLGRDQARPLEQWASAERRDHHDRLRRQTAPFAPGVLLESPGLGQGRRILSLEQDRSLVDGAARSGGMARSGLDRV